MKNLTFAVIVCMSLAWCAAYALRDLANLSNSSFTPSSEQSNSEREVLDIVISQSSSSVQITWSPVSGASNYKVYSSTSPDGVFTADYSGLYAGTSWSAPLTLPKRFYRVTAVQVDIPENFIFVQGGTYNNGYSMVTVNSFYVARYELTNPEWNSVMGTSGGGNAYPAGVSWFDAVEYSNRRSIQEGLIPCYSYLTNGTNPDNWPVGWNAVGTWLDNSLNISSEYYANGYRIPWETEWEFAARGGIYTNNYIYSGSDVLGLVGWYSNNSEGHMHSVGELSSNELGTYDMSGNMWEWCWDQYDANAGRDRVLRSGCVYMGEPYCTVQSRYPCDPAARNSTTGFRVVRRAP